jgi:hypothetical protein
MKPVLPHGRDGFSPVGSSKCAVHTSINPFWHMCVDAPVTLRANYTVGKVYLDDVEVVLIVFRLASGAVIQHWGLPFGCELVLDN